jgi:putative acetyltransferase
MHIRPEHSGDHDAIDELTRRAFKSMPFSQGTEAPILRALRAAGDLTFSFVAEVDGTLVGHIALSPVTIGGVHGGWFGLGPISVEPSLQRSGIGKALIKHGLAALRAQGATGCALIGDPAYYSRVGFRSDGRLSYGDLDRRLVLFIVFTGSTPVGDLRFAPGFDAR